MWRNSMDHSKGNLIAFIPVRGGSKSIPLKNIKDFCGKPLVYWNLRALSAVESISRVYVATDSKEIKSIVTGFSFGKVEIYDRDPKNAEDTSSTESVMLEFIERHHISDDNIFLLSQATCPLTRTEDYLGGILKYMNSGDGSSVLSCSRIKRFFWNDLGFPINYDYLNRPRRQDFAGTLMENGAFFINSVKNIRRFKNRLSDKVEVYEMPEYSAIDIDEPEDWVTAEMAMKRYILPSLF